ncbi:MAG: xylulokinase, partial [Anaerolineae bacterium]|nr:xylulokinase [Anaerolineae bacterium]
LLPVEQDAAFGAALITGVAAGFFDLDPASIQPLVKIERRLEPNTRRHAIYNDLFEIYREADRHLSPIAHQLAEFERR